MLLFNHMESLIVEIFFTHAIEPLTLEIYHQNKQRVLEIDISSERGKVFNYELLKDLILNDAHRKLHTKNENKFEKTGSGFPGWIIVPLAFIASIFLLKRAAKKRRRRRRY